MDDQVLSDNLVMVPVHNLELFGSKHIPTIYKEPFLLKIHNEITNYACSEVNDQTHFKS